MADTEWQILLTLADTVADTVNPLPDTEHPFSQQYFLGRKRGCMY